MHAQLRGEMVHKNRERNIYITHIRGNVRVWRRRVTNQYLNEL